jgi:hypothetical protein
MSRFLTRTAGGRGKFYIVLKWKSIALEAERTQEKNNLSTFVRVKERNDVIFLQI